MEKAYAKVNLYLHVLGKREDGFHNLDTLMVPIDLYDELYFYDCDEIIVDSEIKDNIVLRVADYLYEKYKPNKKVRIVIKKRIPVGAGLAGGSADCSAALRGLNIFWKLNLSIEELAQISLLFGSDTLFCMYNKPAIIRGRGEHIKFFDVDDATLLLVNPKINVSTKEVFRLYLETDKGENDLEMALLRLYPELNKMKEEYLKEGLVLHLSGSGSTYFAYVDSSYEIKEKPQYLQFVQKIIK